MVIPGTAVNMSAFALPPLFMVAETRSDPALYTVTNPLLSMVAVLESPDCHPTAQSTVRPENESVVTADNLVLVTTPVVGDMVAMDVSVLFVIGLKFTFCKKMYYNLDSEPRQMCETILYISRSTYFYSAMLMFVRVRA
jgi:hypothetical protein